MHKTNCMQSIEHIQPGKFLVAYVLCTFRSLQQSGLSILGMQKWCWTMPPDKRHIDNSNELSYIYREKGREKHKLLLISAKHANPKYKKRII